jgi:hypothetical protein
MIQNIKSLITKTFTGKVNVKTALLTLAAGGILITMVVMQTVASAIIGLFALIGLMIVAGKSGDELALINMACMANVLSFILSVVNLIRNARNGNGVRTFFSALDTFNAATRANSIKREYATC